MEKISTKSEPIKIELSAEEKSALEQIVRRAKSEHRIVGRAKIILKLAAGENNSQIARQLEVDRSKVLLWRGRWWEEWARLKEQVSEAKPLLKVVEEMLSDKPRAGAPATFSAEQIVQIMAISCEKPEDSQRPISHWTVRELADEALKREIVEQISRRSVGRFLKAGGVKTG
jgi:putative transposase